MLIQYFIYLTLGNDDICHNFENEEETFRQEEVIDAEENLASTHKDGGGQVVDISTLSTQKLASAPKSKVTNYVIEDFYCPLEWLNYYQRKYLNAKAKFQVLESLDPAKLQCGCRSVRCWTGTKNKKWFCGHCKYPMRSNCVHEGERGVCHSCFFEKYNKSSSSSSNSLINAFQSPAKGTFKS